MEYTDYTQNYVNEFAPGYPIYTKNLAQKLAERFGLNREEAMTEASLALNRLLNSEETPLLRQWKDGIFYNTAVTPFGEMGIFKALLAADKYLMPYIGYETGHSALNRMGLTSMMPNRRTLASNMVDKEQLDEEFDVWVVPPKTKVNRKNKKSLQFLDAVELMGNAPVDIDSPYTYLANYAQKAGLDFGYLFSLAHQYYDLKTVRRLERIARKAGK